MTAVTMLLLIFFCVNFLAIVYESHVWTVNTKKGSGVELSSPKVHQPALERLVPEPGLLQSLLLSHEPLDLPPLLVQFLGGVPINRSGQRHQAEMRCLLTDRREEGWPAAGSS